MIKSESLEGVVLQERYRMGRSVGQGSSGITYAAQDLQTGGTVAIKVLSLAGLKDWKQLELFEREAKVLKHLSHSGIPDYLDYFQTEHNQNQFFCLVQALAEGRSLAARIEAGERVNETEAKRIARSILEVLDYLHRLHPPIVHRDLKPQNIILRDDGVIFLVDFGAVQAVYQDTMLSSSTIVGTYGYMAPEQFRGAAGPASDLYSLGATLLFLLTHRSPAELPQVRMKVDFRNAVNVSEEFADWLESLLEPIVEDRVPSATEAIAALDNPGPKHLASAAKVSGGLSGGLSDELSDELTSSSPGQLIPTPLLQKPSNTHVELLRKRRRIEMVIPPGGMRAEAMAMGGFALFWNGFIFFWTFMSIATGAPIFFSLFSIPFWLAGGWMMYQVLSGLFGRVTLTVKGTQYKFTRQLLNWTRTHEGPASDLYQVQLQTSYSQNNRPVRCLALTAGAKTYKFGTMLSEGEKAWLQQELSIFLKTQKH